MPACLMCTEKLCPRYQVTTGHESATFARVWRGGSILSSDQCSGPTCCMAARHASPLACAGQEWLHTLYHAMLRTRGAACLGWAIGPGQRTQLGDVCRHFLAWEG
jgi:hypothetical protein